MTYRAVKEKEVDNVQYLYMQRAEFCGVRGSGESKQQGMGDRPAMHYCTYTISEMNTVFKGVRNGNLFGGDGC